MRKATETSSSGRQVSYTYDAASQPWQTIDGVSGTLDPSITVNLGSVTRQTQIHYSSIGLLASLADGKGNTLHYYYDEFDRLSEIDYPDGSYELIGYDAANNKIGFQTRSTNSVYYYYDTLNRLYEKDVDQQTAYIQYGYDYTGRLIGLYSSADPTAYSFGYDTAGRAISLKQPSGSVVSWTVDADGNRTSLTWPETGALAYSTSYAYDAMNRLTDVFEGAASAGVLLGHYSYDALSERTGIAYGGTTAAAGGRAPIATTAATYTTGGQIAQIVHSLNGSALTLGYSYNQDHQRTGVSASDATYLVSGLTAASHTYAPNNLNQYATVGATAYTYDTNGNLKSDGTWTYTYSNENILLTATATGSMVSYAYDPQNLRKSKTVNGTTTSYLNIPKSLASASEKSIDPTTFGFIAGNQEIAEYDASGNLLRRYVYGSGLDEPLVTIDAVGNHFYHFTDGLGSVLALANTSGQLVEKHAYSAYGLASSTTGTAFQFAGRRVDPETGLYYNRARYYSPSLGRFLQTDPIGTDGGTNLYAYAGSDPTNSIDPTGLDTVVIITRDPVWGTGGLLTFGSHAAVHVDNAGSPVLYDPAGSYLRGTPARGTDDTLYDADAAVAPYAAYQKSIGSSSVTTYTFKTSAQEESTIASNIDQQGGAGALMCATSVSSVISGVGPFQGVGSFYPATLSNQLGALPGGTVTLK
jgi:RHS repeat-associated protein